MADNVKVAVRVRPLSLQVTPHYQLERLHQEKSKCESDGSDTETKLWELLCQFLRGMSVLTAHINYDCGAQEKARGENVCVRYPNPNQVIKIFAL